MGEIDPLRRGELKHYITFLASPRMARECDGFEARVLRYRFMVADFQDWRRLWADACVWTAWEMKRRAPRAEYNRSGQDFTLARERFTLFKERIAALDAVRQRVLRLEEDDI